MNSYGKKAKQNCMEQMRQLSVECSLEEIDEMLDFFRQVEKDFEENGVAGEYVAEMERKEKHPDEPIFKIRIVPPISKKEKSRRRRRIAVNNFFMGNSRRLAACVTLLLMIAACLLMIRKNRKGENK